MGVLMGRRMGAGARAALPATATRALLLRACRLQHTYLAPTALPPAPSAVTVALAFKTYTTHGIDAPQKNHIFIVASMTVSHV